MTDGQDTIVFGNSAHNPAPSQTQEQERQGGEVQGNVSGRLDPRIIHAMRQELKIYPSGVCPCKILDDIDEDYL
jgi:hypothetical protein